MQYFERDTFAERDGAGKGYEVLQEMAPDIPSDAELLALASKHASEDGFRGKAKEEYIEQFVNQFIYDM
jgi:hypothetical protein